MVSRRRGRLGGLVPDLVELTVEAAEIVESKLAAVCKGGRGGMYGVGLVYVEVVEVVVVELPDLKDMSVPLPNVPVPS